MNSFKNEYSYRNKFKDKYFNTSKNKNFSNLKLTHKIFDSINFSLLGLIFILSFLSFNSQREWTNIYRHLAYTKAANTNLIDYISKTEELYINKLESLNTFKKTTPKDLIYLNEEISKEKKNYLVKKIMFIKYGLKDSSFQRGY